MIITNNYIKLTLRRIFVWSEQHTEVIKRCRIDRGQYKCEKCGDIFKQKEIKVHHIIEIDTFVDWNQYISRLFCSAKDLLGICKTCHNNIHNKNGNKIKKQNVRTAKQNRITSKLEKQLVKKS